ncbi:flp pilus-assembly TadE/G-like family protein [Collimonas arenae]|uniref:Flp pilus-assembly TadE/G-like family protein n=1 Tax=Collimonas arenae TaxID=279058 RepID=A0A127QKM9_9BURK|nr:pilus assembly protein TadG-related protein [Collimonas arenae]AMP10611.1 flp pilus-assembly TadE/G-like family protein [Collimonas arenae]
MVELRRRYRSRGQTLILFLGFAAALVSAFLIAFNTGQTSNAKMRAMNAADAAAYSGAVWEARTLNFQAYMNRAMIANEVAIAQSVSLRSWVSYVDTFMTNINDITQFIPYVGEVTTAVQKAIKGVDKFVQASLPLGEQILRGVNFVASSSQQAINVIGVKAATELAGGVAQANGAQLTGPNTPLTGTLFLSNEASWLGLTSSYCRTTNFACSNDLRRLREVALNSRDGFTYSRAWKDRWPFMLPFIFNVRKQGGTDLIDYDSWKGLDSAELQRWNPKKMSWGKGVPLGWGGAQAYNPNVVTRVGTHGSINEWDHFDGRKANTTANYDNQKKMLFPFPNYRDIAKPAVQNADLHVPFAVEVFIPKNQIKTSDEMLSKDGKPAQAILFNGTVVNPSPNFANGNEGVYALATGCVRFSRPIGSERASGRTEYPSLFNPYWRASLATNSRINRLAVDIVKKLPESALLEGNSSCS